MKIVTKTTYIARGRFEYDDRLCTIARSQNEVKNIKHFMKIVEQWSADKCLGKFTCESVYKRKEVIEFTVYKGILPNHVTDRSE